MAPLGLTLSAHLLPALARADPVRGYGEAVSPVRTTVQGRLDLRATSLTRCPRQGCPWNHGEGTTSMTL